MKRIVLAAVLGLFASSAAAQQNPFKLPKNNTSVAVEPKLAASLAATRPELRILYMSGFTESAVMYHGVLDPGTEFIQKPFSPQALGLKVQEVLRKAAAGAP